MFGPETKSIFETSTTYQHEKPGETTVIRLKSISALLFASTMAIAWMQVANASQGLTHSVSFASVNSGFRAQLARTAEVGNGISIEIQRESNWEWQPVCSLRRTHRDCLIPTLSGINANVRFRTIDHSKKRRWIEKYLIAKTPNQADLISAVVKSEQTSLVSYFGSSASGLSEGSPGFIGGVRIYWSTTNPTWAKVSLIANDPGIEIFRFVKGKWRYQGSLATWPQDTGQHFQLPKRIQEGNWLEISVSRQILGYH